MLLVHQQINIIHLFYASVPYKLDFNSTKHADTIKKTDLENQHWRAEKQIVNVLTEKEAN